mmetsp:Transcript_2812/g.8720  ORF Transcript_2812/g.8720 Transcript_2812/m.8720 type:complete len:335 (-) Transcript_2812:2183-3187(-)
MSGHTPTSSSSRRTHRSTLRSWRSLWARSGSKSFGPSKKCSRRYSVGRVVRHDLHRRSSSACRTYSWPHSRRHGLGVMHAPQKTFPHPLFKPPLAVMAPQKTATQPVNDSNGNPQCGHAGRSSARIAAAWSRTAALSASSGVIAAAAFTASASFSEPASPSSPRAAAERFSLSSSTAVAASSDRAFTTATACLRHRRSTDGERSCPKSLRSQTPPHPSGHVIVSRSTVSSCTALRTRAVTHSAHTTCSLWVTTASTSFGRQTAARKARPALWTVTPHRLHSRDTWLRAGREFVLRSCCFGKAVSVSTGDIRISSTASFAEIFAGGGGDRAAAPP